MNHQAPARKKKKLQGSNLKKSHASKNKIVNTNKALIKAFQKL
jgi:hypothetical protein